MGTTANALQSANPTFSTPSSAGANPNGAAANADKHCSPAIHAVICSANPAVAQIQTLPFRTNAQGNGSHHHKLASHLLHFQQVKSQDGYLPASAGPGTFVRIAPSVHAPPLQILVEDRDLVIPPPSQSEDHCLL